MAFVGIAGLLLTVASTAFKVIGGIQQAKAQQQQAEAQAKIAEQEAAEEKRKRLKTRDRLAGAQRASFGAAGVTLGGSPKVVETEDLKEGTLDALTIFRRGQRTAAVKRFEGRQARARVPGIIAGGIGNIGSSLVTASAGGLFGGR